MSISAYVAKELGSINLFNRTIYTDLGSENFTWWVGHEQG